jgi:hypothetical protein
MLVVVALFAPRGAGRVFAAVFTPLEKFFLEVVDASESGIVRSILTKPFGAVSRMSFLVRPNSMFEL